MVTAVTISTLTTVAVSSFAVGIGIFATLMLIGLLTGKELLHSGTGYRKTLLARSLSISIIPLLIGFVVIVGVKVAEVLT